MTTGPKKAAPTQKSETVAKRKGKRITNQSGVGRGNSRYSDAEWDAALHRYVNGEKIANLAKEYDVSLSTMSSHISERKRLVKQVAKKSFRSQQQVSTLPLNLQGMATSMADNLKMMAMHMSSAGNYGAATAHRFAMLAHEKSAEIDPADVDLDKLREINALQETANRAAVVPMDILRQMKDNVPQETAPKAVSQLEYIEARKKLLNDV